jgi:endonuclease/exonuclease/phosphatase family metal-dependent hydrolase
MRIKILTWNLFHGRDAPPDPGLHTWRSRILRRTEDNGSYVQVNRSLHDEFAQLIATADWEICLLQETPPDWAESLAARSGARFVRCLTSRNQFGFVTRPLARRNPDLIQSWEGGSNLTLVRPPWQIVEGSRRSLLLRPLRERGLRERRRMSFVKIARNDDAGGSVELCVANIHADFGPPTERELRRAAETAVRWADERPLVLGGDFNLRTRSSKLFDELEQELGLGQPTAGDAIDHLLARGLEVIRPPDRCAEAARELQIPHGAGIRRIRLSDHAPVQAIFGIPARAMR